MDPFVRYQVFISSTYEDLREERQQATQAVLEAGYFPSGMELFPASDDSQWELIKRVIEECDYYIVIVAGRYGTVSSNGLSFTEMEYDYAVSKGIPVLGFVRSDTGAIPFDRTEKSEEGRNKLEAFRKKVQARTCRLYSNPAELGMAVMKSLIAETRLRPQTGWIRADQARSADDIEREKELKEALRKAQKVIDKLTRQIRDRAVLVDEVPKEHLAQGTDMFELQIFYQDDKKQLVCDYMSLTWDEIFTTIGPSMYGYILRRDRENKYIFETSLEEYIRSKIINKVQNRKIKLSRSHIDTIIIQLKELGYLFFEEKEEDDGSIFRGITLTELGERQLARLSTKFSGDAHVGKHARPLATSKRNRKHA